jgi:phosphate transport system protein
MVLTKKYILEKINARRNDIIEVSGLIRKMLLISDKSIKKGGLFPLEELTINQNKVVELRKRLDDENVRLVTEADINKEDLRLIIGGMRMISNLEKIGKNTLRIAEIFRDSDICKKTNIVLSDMTGIIFMMFDGVFVGFIYREMENCYNAIKEDVTLDGMKSEKTRIMIDIMMKEKELMSAGVNMTDVISSLERIGDYIVNIAEDIVFIFSGEDIRYKS